MIAILAAILLVVADVPRLVPDIPEVPAPWEEQGNRRARRRAAAVGRKGR